MKFKIQKTRDVKTPHRTHDYDAGLDFFIPNDIGWETFTLKPGIQKLFPSGIKADIPEGFALICMEKSSIATKGLIIGARVVDAEYQGEIHIHIMNVSNEDVTIRVGQKICQFILMPIIKTDVILVPPDKQLYDKVTDRSFGGFGSTGTGVTAKDWWDKDKLKTSTESKGKFTGKKTIKGDSGSIDFSRTKSKADDEEME